MPQAKAHPPLKHHLCQNLLIITDNLKKFDNSGIITICCVSYLNISNICTLYLSTYLYAQILSSKLLTWQIPLNIWSIHRLEQFPHWNVRIIFWLHNIEGWPKNILFIYWYIRTFYERYDSIWMSRKGFDQLLFILICFISGSNIIYLVLIITLQLNTKNYWDTLKRTKQIKSQIRSPILLRKMRYILTFDLQLIIQWWGHTG